MRRTETGNLTKASGRLRAEDGQTVIEYVLVIVIIVFVLLYAFETSDIELGISNAASKVAETAAAGVANISGL